jgi:rod shape-determining protein MreD
LIILLLALIIVLNTVFQTTILPYFSIFGYLPNTALVLTVIIAIFRGKYYGIFFGLAIGIIQDILFGTVIGVNALLYSMIGYSIGIVKNVLNTENIIVPTVFTAIATIFYNFSYAIVIFFLSREITLSIMIKNTFSIEIILNFFISIIIYKLLSKIFTVPTLKFGNR